MPLVQEVVWTTTESYQKSRSEAICCSRSSGKWSYGPVPGLHTPESSDPAVQLHHAPHHSGQGPPHRIRPLGRLGGSRSEVEKRWVRFMRKWWMRFCSVWEAGVRNVMECHPQSDMDGIGWQFGNIFSLPSWAGESCNANWWLRVAKGSRYDASCRPTAQHPDPGASLKWLWAKEMWGWETTWLVGGVAYIVQSCCAILCQEQRITKISFVLNPLEQLQRPQMHWTGSQMTLSHYNSFTCTDLKLSKVV